MSLERAALRLSTVMALANGFAAPFPTMAGGFVFDSRLDPIQVATGDEVSPVVLVCTDDDMGSSISSNNGGPPFERHVSMTIDLALATAIDVDGQANVVTPRSEPELEMRLDLFEAQIERVLTERSGTWGREFDKVARRITDWHSIRYVEPASNVRMTARQIQMTVLLQPSEHVADLTVVGAAAGADVVPAPLGPLLAAIIASGSPFAPAATVIRDQMLAGGAGRRTALPAMTRIRMLETDHGGGFRAAGVADVVTTP